MGNILKFPLEFAQRRSFKNIDNNTSAEILVFEGIRYDRKEMRAEMAAKQKSVLKK